jgi:hypothetical protein
MPTTAEIAARKDLYLYKQAVQKFGRVVIPMLNDIPKTLAIAHILRVNPALDDTPAPTWDQRKGFMRVTHDATIPTGISWNAATDMNSNAYIWGWDLNSAGPIFQRANPSFFPEPSVDFWQCLYAQHAFGARVFDFLWKRRDTAEATQFAALSHSLSNWGKHIAGWSYVLLQRTMNVELPYVYAVASANGRLVSKGFGLRPVLSSSRMQQTLI